MRRPKQRKGYRRVAVLPVKKPGKILLSFHRRDLRFSDETMPRLQSNGYLGTQWNVWVCEVQALLQMRVAFKSGLNCYL